MYNEPDGNPFQDGTDFENFLSSRYGGNVSKKVLAEVNLNTPLNIFKYVLVKITPIFTADEMKNNPFVYEKTMEKFKEARAKYKEFESKKITMSPRERKNVMAAHATLELGEIAMTVCGKSGDPELHNFHDMYLAKPANIEKFGQICTDILEGKMQVFWTSNLWQTNFYDIFVGNNPIGEGLVEFGAIIREHLSRNHSHGILRFLICWLVEAIKRSKKTRIDNGLFEQSLCLEASMERMEKKLYFYKLSFMGVVLTMSSTLLTVGPDPELERILKDEKTGNKLLNLLEDCEKDDDFHKLPLKIETQDYEQARKIYEFLLMCSDEIEGTEFHNRPFDQENLEGIAQSYLAAFATDPAEVYRLAETSLKLLEGIVACDEEAVMKFE